MNVKRIRREMWLNDPTCHWCHRMTVLPVAGQSTTNSDTATIDHLYSRWHHSRGTAPIGEGPLVLSCGQCNHDRGVIAQELYLATKRATTARASGGERLVKLAEAFPRELLEAYGLTPRSY